MITDYSILESVVDEAIRVHATSIIGFDGLDPRFVSRLEIFTMDAGFSCPVVDFAGSPKEGGILIVQSDKKSTGTCTVQRFVTNKGKK